MGQIIIWILLNYGLMNIMVFGSIFQGLRDYFRDLSTNHLSIYKQVGEFFHKMITCPMCFSFHGGWFLSVFLFSPIHEMFLTPIWYSWFFDAILSSGSVWIINSIVEWFEENRP